MVSEVIMQNFPEERVNDQCGRLSLNQSAAVVKNCRLLISHDTGMMHIGAAFKKDIISVWGNTIPELGMYPYMAGKDSRIFEVKDLSCRPCSKIGFRECPKKHFHCMEKQDINEMASFVNSLMQ